MATWPHRVGRTLWWQEYVVEELHYLTMDRNQRVNKTPRTRNNFQRSALQPSDLLSSIRPTSLSFQNLLK